MWFFGGQWRVGLIRWVRKMLHNTWERVIVGHKPPKYNDDDCCVEELNMMTYCFQPVVKAVYWDS